MIAGSIPACSESRRIERANDAWYPGMTWDNDQCSAPLVGNSPWDFTYPCNRHDFGYRNLKRIENRFGIDVWLGLNKAPTDSHFSDEMFSRCAEWNFAVRPQCNVTNQAYFSAVAALPPWADTWMFALRTYSWY